MSLSIVDKLRIFHYFMFNKIDYVYILTPKLFYYYLAFMFRKTKFYAITIKAKRNRPPEFLLKYLYKFSVIDRSKLTKRNSSYQIQYKLIDNNSVASENLIKKESSLNHNLQYPDDFIFYPSTSSAYKQIGNAVPPVFGWHLANAIEQFLKHNYIENNIKSAKLMVNG